MNKITYPDRDALMVAVARALSRDLRQALAQNDRATFSVPGGTTPGPVFDLLSAVDLDWSRVDIMLNDERWVPESSARSNMALLRARLLQNHARAAHLVPLYAAYDTPELGIPHLIEHVEACLPINVLLLGMGEDMHTASLFPGADQLAQAFADDAPTVLAMRAPGALEPRITLSAAVLKAVHQSHVLIAGAEKARALARAERCQTPLEAPIKAVLDQAIVHWAP